jgi:two-component system sensor histidine kinase MprB
VQVARPLEETNLVVAGLRSRLILIVIGAGALAAVVGAWMARRIARPIQSLAATVDLVAATGDFSAPIEVGGDDEVGRLAAGFDNLLRTLSASRRQQNQLVQDVAHELRTPLTSIRANVDLLAVAPDMDTVERSQMLDSVRVEVRELTTLVNEIVEVAGTGGDTAQPRRRVDLGELANEAVERFRLRTGRTVRVEVRPTMVDADPDGLLRAMSNLLSNADKYSPDGRPITVSVPGDGWVSVADQGVGMTADDRHRAFDRFFRADEARAQPGSGLGLAIVRSIVEAHGGRVALTANPGGGTVASFFIPPDA